MYFYWFVKGINWFLQPWLSNGKCRTWQKQICWYLRTLRDCDVGWVHMWRNFPLTTRSLLWPQSSNKSLLQSVRWSLQVNEHVLTANHQEFSWWSDLSFEVKDQSFCNFTSGIQFHSFESFWSWSPTIDWQTLSDFKVSLQRRSITSTSAFLQRKQEWPLRK